MGHLNTLAFQVAEPGTPTKVLSPCKRTSPHKAFAAVFKSTKKVQAKRTGAGKRAYFESTARVRVIRRGSAIAD